MENVEGQRRTTLQNTSFLQSLLHEICGYADVRNLTGLRVACWVILALAGLAQAWFARHRIVADGVSYLEIARNYVKGDWHAALNSYWSPLYSWLAAILMVLLHPSPYWEVALLYLVNYCAYLAALVGFELWLGALIRLQSKVISSRGMSEQTMRLVGYSIFLVATLLRIDLGWNSPDMVVTSIGFFLAYLLFGLKLAQRIFPLASGLEFYSA